jgi:hypothetical protein
MNLVLTRTKIFGGILAYAIGQIQGGLSPWKVGCCFVLKSHYLCTSTEQKL